MVEGLTIDDNQLAQDAYLETQPGENFLSTEHTMRNFRDASYPSFLLADTQSYEQWSEVGRNDAETRAHHQFLRKLKEYEAPPLDESHDEALLSFIKQRKESMPDQWH